MVKRGNGMSNKVALINHNALNEDNYNLIAYFINTEDFLNDSSIVSGDKEHLKRLLELFNHISGHYSEKEHGLGMVLSSIKDTPMAKDIDYYTTLTGCLPQKVSRLLNNLAKQGLIVRTVYNGVAYFRGFDDFNVGLNKICERVNEYIKAYSE